ncbi:17964_t:CDS:2, partial [Dentiscutata erythropus]
EPTSIKSLNITEDYANNEYEDIAWFSLTDIENLIANCFESEEHDHACFSETLKFNEDFVNMHNKNQESNKEVTYHNIAESLPFSFESIRDNIELNIYKQNELVEFRKAELEEDKKEALRARRQQKTWDPPRGSKLLVAISSYYIPKVVPAFSYTCFLVIPL